MRPRIVDANVLVAGVISRDREAPPATLLDLMLRGGFPFLLSIDLLAEYRTVLLRPALVARHGWSAERVDRLLAALAFHGIVREPGAVDAADVPDPGDAHLFALLAADERALLVTGDRRLLEAPAWRGRVISPSAAVSAISS